MITPRRESVAFRIQSLAIAGCLLAAVAVRAETTDSSTPAAAKVREITIKGEPLKIEPGKPMSSRALVSEPGQIPGALSWTVETRLHRGVTIVMALSPDGKQVATGGVDGAIRIWDLADGKLVRVIVGHDWYVSGLSWSPDGKSLASAGSHDASMRVWDVATGQPLRRFKAHKEWAGKVAWSPDGTRLLASGGQSGWVWMWDTRTDKEGLVVELGQPIYSIDWSPSGDLIAVSILQGAVNVIDVASGKTREAVDDPTTTHYCVRWSPDGERLLVGSASSAIIFKMPGAETLKTLVGQCYSAAWSPDGKQVATTNSGVAGQLFDADAGKLIKAFPAGGSEVIWRLPEQLVVRHTTDLHLWNPAELKETAVHTVARVTPPVWTPGGRPIISGMGTNTLTLWENGTGKLLHKLEGHVAAINDVSWTRDGRTLATASSDKTIGLWETSSGKLLHQLKDHAAIVMSVAWAPDGKTLASAGYDQKVRLWSLKGEPLGTLEGHKKPVTQLAWSPRGNLLASGAPTDSVNIWNPDKLQLSTSFPISKQVRALAFSPDGSILGGGMYDEVVQLWSPSGGKSITLAPRYAKSPRYVNALSWSPDGSALLLGGINGYNAYLWDWQEPKIINSLLTMAPVVWTAWAPGGVMMVAGNEDGTVRFWDTPTAGIRGLVIDEGDHIVLLSANGNYRIDKSFEPDFLFVMQAENEQLNMSVAEFAGKYKWKNVPTAVKFTGR